MMLTDSEESQFRTVVRNIILYGETQYFKHYIIFNFVCIKSIVLLGTHFIYNLQDKT